VVEVEVVVEVVVVVVVEVEVEVEVEVGVVVEVEVEVEVGVELVTSSGTATGGCMATRLQQIKDRVEAMWSKLADFKIGSNERAKVSLYVDEVVDMLALAEAAAKVSEFASYEEGSNHEQYVVHCEHFDPFELAISRLQQEAT